MAGATLLGAAVGAAIGYLYLTERGRAVRTDSEPRLDEALAEVRRLGGAVGKFRTAVSEGRRTFDQFVAGNERTPEWVTSYRSNSGS